MSKEEIPRFRSIEYYSDYEWSMEQVYEVANKNIEQLQSQLDIANKKLEEIDTFIRGHQLFGMRFAKTLYRECLEYILSIIGGE